MADAPLDVLRARLKEFLVFLRPRLLTDGVDQDRLAQLRRLSDVRIRKFLVGRTRITGLDLCGLLEDPKAGSFKDVADGSGLVRLGHLASPLPVLGEDMGLVVEACLLHQVLGRERTAGHAAAFVARNGPAPLPAGVVVPGAPSAAPAPLPQAVEKLLGSAKELWSPSPSLTRPLELLGAADTPADAVCAEIQKDGALASHFLRFANASPYGAANRLGSLKIALVALGYPVARRFLRVAALLGRFGEARIDLRAHWTRTFQVAHAAAQIARLSKLGHPDEHFCAGVLHSIGKLAVARHLPSDDTPGTSVAEIGACLLERWRFPAAIVEAARRHGSTPEELEEIQVPREAVVVAALHHLIDGPWELPGWAGFLRVAGDAVPGILQKAAPPAAKSAGEFTSGGTS